MQPARLSLTGHFGRHSVFNQLTVCIAFRLKVIFAKVFGVAGGRGTR